jgi:hypothetical protein
MQLSDKGTLYRFMLQNSIIYSKKKNTGRVVSYNLPGYEDNKTLKQNSSPVKRTWNRLISQRGVHSVVLCPHVISLWLSWENLISSFTLSHLFHLWFLSQAPIPYTGCFKWTPMHGITKMSQGNFAKTCLRRWRRWCHWTLRSTIV